MRSAYSAYNARQCSALDIGEVLVSLSMGNKGCSLLEIVEVLSKVRRRHSCCRLALGATPTIEYLVVLGAQERWAHNIAAKDRVGIVVHGHAAAHAFCPGPVLRHLHGLRPTKGTASSHVLWALVRKGRLAVDRLALNALASVDIRPRGVYGIAGSNGPSGCLHHRACADEKREEDHNGLLHCHGGKMRERAAEDLSTS